jgi:2'-5' RNA ligase
METIRAFIAIDIPHEVKEKFSEAQGKLRRAGADVRWVQPHNAHVTLQFLGDTPVEKIEGIKAALRRVAASHRAFEVAIEGLGVFPNARRPRAVWIGVCQGANELAALQRSVGAEMRHLGFQPEERPFSAHITLGRVKSPKNTERLASILDAERAFHAGRFLATEIRLIRSVLSSEGPTYTPLCSGALLAASK